MTHSIFIERRETDEMFFQRTNNSERVLCDSDTENLAFTLDAILKNTTIPEAKILVMDEGNTIFAASYNEDGVLSSADLTFHDDYEFTGNMLWLEDYAWDGGSGGTFLWQGGTITPGETVSVLHLYSR